MSRNGQSGKILNNQKGFTLIELIIVIVILGILAVVAVPTYQDLRADAREAVGEGLLAAARGAAVMNFGRKLVDPTRPEITANASGAATLAGLIDYENALTPSNATLETTINGEDYVITITSGETSAAAAVINGSF